jgi:hypothetical protein
VRSNEAVSVAQVIQPGVFRSAKILFAQILFSRLNRKSADGLKTCFTEHPDLAGRADKTLLQPEVVRSIIDEHKIARSSGGKWLRIDSSYFHSSENFFQNGKNVEPEVNDGGDREFFQRQNVVSRKT